MRIEVPIMKNIQVTTGWVIISALSGVISYAFLYMAYVFLLPIYVKVGNQAEQFAASSQNITPTQLTNIQTLFGNLTLSVNAAFVLIAVAIFLFMLFSAFRETPTSWSGGYNY